MSATLPACPAANKRASDGSAFSIQAAERVRNIGGRLYAKSLAVLSTLCSVSAGRATEYDKSRSPTRSRIGALAGARRFLPLVPLGDLAGIDGAGEYSRPSLRSPRVPPEQMRRAFYVLGFDSRRSVGVRRTYAPVAAFDAAPSLARLICIGRVVGALLACGRRLSRPALLGSLLPLRSPTCCPHPCTRRPRSSVCANAQPAGVCASDGRARPATLSPCGSLCAGSLPFPPHLCAPLRSAHATQTTQARATARRVCYFVTAGCRGRAYAAYYARPNRA